MFKNVTANKRNVERKHINENIIRIIKKHNKKPLRNKGKPEKANLLVLKIVLNPPDLNLIPQSPT